MSSTLSEPAQKRSLSTRDSLKSAIQAIERSENCTGLPGLKGHPPDVARVSTGVDVLDAALPWGGLPKGMVHDIIAPTFSGAGIGFAAVLSALLSADQQDGSDQVIWCGRFNDLYGPGLVGFGLDLCKFLMIEAPSKDDIPWVLEESVRSATPAVVVGMMPRRAVRAAGAAYDVMVRRLQLAAARYGVTVLLVHHSDRLTNTGSVEARGVEARGVETRGVEARGPVATRWCVRPALSSVSPLTGHPMASPAAPVWHLDLVRCRGGGRPGHWTVAWQPDAPPLLPFQSTSTPGSYHDSTFDRGISRRPAPHRLALVSAISDRSVAPVATAGYGERPVTRQQHAG